MGVRIEEVNVENLGPISDLRFELGQLSLIYGRNEEGKTFLVEFILRSLFKDLSDWRLRPLTGRGQVIVSGLGDKAISFTPSSRQKLESYLEKSSAGLPPKMSRLLVVKGAELGMDDRIHGGINKGILKGYLSGQSMLDAILNRIPTTIQQATIEDGIVRGAKRGDIKKHRDAQKDKEHLDGLFEELDQLYSDGRRQSLRDERQKLLEARNELTRAKRHLAYQLDNRKRELEAEAVQYPEETLKKIGDNIRDYRTLEKGIEGKQQELEILESGSDNYRWLESAISEYERRIETTQLEVNRIYLVLTIILLVLALLTGLYGLAIVPGVLVLIAFVTGWLYIRQLRDLAANAPGAEEIQKLEAEFQRRFDEPLTGLPLMQEKKKQLEEQHYRAQTLTDQVRTEQEKLNALGLLIADEWRALTGQDANPSNWQDAINALSNRRNQLLSDANGLDMQLVRLDVPPFDYIAEPAGIAFEQEHLNSLNQRLSEVEIALTNETDELDRLKQRICDVTGDDITINWESLIQNLRVRRENALRTLKRRTSRLLSRICLCAVLAEIREQEDEKIRQNLESSIVQSPLKEITGRYESLRLDGDQLFVSDPYGAFKVSELSTGAREQVLLALRLGIASRILDKERLFLILDDAFQHSDWQRRERLVDQSVSLANQGWQVIYFTMDDHLKSLFDDKGAAQLGDDYRSIVLTEASSS